MKNIVIKKSTKIKNFRIWIKNNPRRFYALLLIVISLFIFYLDKADNTQLTLIKRYISNRTTKMTVKIHLKYNNYIDNFKESLINHKNLVLENKQLRKQNLSLLKNQLLVSMLIIENLQLKSLVNFLSQHKEIEYISTRALKISNEFNDYALIPLGNRDGIKSDQAVVNDNGLIGKIIKVEKEFSYILLITDKRFRIPVKILDTNVEAIVTGHNNNSLKLLYLSEDYKIQDGNTVVTSGNTTIPEGIHVGNIQGKDKTITKVNIKNIDFVSVIKVKEID